MPSSPFSAARYGAWSRPTPCWWLIVPPWATIASLAARLQPAPALERLVRVGGEPEDVGRVQARAARVDVRQVAERVDPLAVGRRARGGAPGRPRRRGPAAASSRPRSRACRPRSRASHSASRRSGVRKRSRSQRRPIEPPTPMPPCRGRVVADLADGASTSCSRPGSRRRARGSAPARSGRAAEVAAEQSARRGRRRRRASGVAVSSGVETRTIDSGRPAGPLAAASIARGQSGRNHARNASTRGFGTVADGRLGEDAEPALRAEDELAQVRAGGRGRDGRQLERPGRRLDAAAGEQGLDPPEARATAGRPTGPRPSRRASSARTTAGSGRASGRAARAPPRGPGRASPPRTSRGRSARRGRGGRRAARERR